ncbi:MAG: hypothetical protein ACE5I1_29070 [bacterium]
MKDLTNFPDEIDHFKPPRFEWFFIIIGGLFAVALFIAVLLLI